MKMTRRDAVRSGVLGLGGVASWAGGLDVYAAQVSNARPGAPEFAARVQALEASCGGRLGVMVLDTGSGRRAGYKEGERFSMCSTFKMLLAAAVLARVDGGKERLEREVAVPATGLVEYTPVTGEHKGGTMTVEALCRAAVEVSDNEAANLLLEQVGGPAGVTTFLRGMGDSVTRLDRTEPTLNEAAPGDVRDTTSPAAIVGSWRRIVLGEALRPGSRALLTGWLVDCQTGRERLRKGIGNRAGWRIGDKTGTADTTCNDIAVIWPAGRAPVLAAAFLTECPGTDGKRNGVIAEVGRMVAEWIG